MDDIILNKVAIIDKCLKRIEEEYRGHEGELNINFTKQDSIVLNLQRACEAAIDLGTRIVRIRKLGVPQSSRDVFSLLAQHDMISKELAEKLEAMVGFRNIAVHDYQKINLEIVAAIIEHRLADLIKFKKIALSLGKHLEKQ